jgi:hypothetical protein
MINLNNHMESKQTAIESLAVDEQKYPHLAAHREKASIGCINLAKYTSVCDRACLCAATALSNVRFLGGTPVRNYIYIKNIKIMSVSPEHTSYGFTKQAP